MSKLLAKLGIEYVTIYHVQHNAKGDHFHKILANLTRMPASDSLENLDSFLTQTFTTVRFDK